MMVSIVQLAFAVPVSVIVIDTLLRFAKRQRERKELPRPPGPTPIPLLGNILSVNLEEPWKTYTKWHGIYGNVLYLRLLDQDVIVLGSQPITLELLEKRSQLYSDRPFIATVAPFGIDSNFAFIPYGDHWRLCRRIFHQTFRADAAISFRPMQLRKARQLVVNILEDTERYCSHFSTFAAAVAMCIAYAYDSSPRDDPIVHVIEGYTTAAVQVATPEKAILLKLFPFLLQIPDRFPGSTLKLEARHSRGLSEKMVEMPYQYVMERMVSDECPVKSMVSEHVVRMQQYGEQDRTDYVYALKVAGSSSLQASAETIMASLMVFTLAMVMHPHVWKRAQAEIDSVVGINRLPEFDDRASLPYVEAIIRETVRWRPVVPLGVPHATTGDDIFNGHYIPKGTTVIANAWAMSRDETRFPNAEEFTPERFLTEEGSLNNNDPMDFIFGFGRRKCPGRYAADASLWSSIATMLATLDFYPPRDAEGKDATFEPKFLYGVTHRPDTFPCRISPRSHVQTPFLERALAT